jgi:hypothetical protein
MWNMVLVRHWMVDVLCKLKRTTVNESRYSLFWSFFTNSVSPQCRPISLIGYDLLKVSVNKHDFLYMNIVWDTRTTFTLIESIRLTPYSTDNEGESESDRKSPKERKIANCKNTCSTICLVHIFLCLEDPTIHASERPMEELFCDHSRVQNTKKLALAGNQSFQQLKET